jgi:lysyl-tRNA synthetase class II
LAFPKRFPDREQIDAVRVDAAQVEPGKESGEPRRVAGRVMARRDMGKLVFLDLVDRSEKSRGQVLR